MASQKLTALTALTTPAPEDITYIVDDVAGTPVERKITLADLAKGFQTVVCTGQSLTGSQATSLVDLAATWNTSGTPTAFLLNVTDTASNAASLLMDLRVGGISRFSESKNGHGIFTFNTAAIGTAISAIGTDGVTYATIGSGGFVTRNSLAILSSTSTVGTLNIGGGQCNITHATGNLSQIRTFGNLALQPGALGGGGTAIEVVNGTNAQTFRVYGTYTDASNYRRLTNTMSTSGVAEIKPEGAGTGALGNVLHISGLPTSNPGPGILWNNSGTPAIGT